MNYCVIVNVNQKNTSMDIKKKAHEGKIVTVKDSKFFLLKERVRGGCKGCDLINTLGCTKEITDLCRQGFIFKKLKK